MIGQPPRDTPATGASALPEEIVENELPSQEVGVADVPEALVYVAPQWKLVWWRFRKHRLATISAAILLVIYGVAAFAEFVAPTTGDANNPAYTYAPPQRVHVWDSGHLGLYVYGYKMTRDPVTLEQSFKVDRTQKIPLTLFGRGPSYRMWGLFDTSRHLLAPTPRDAPVYLLGANALGQDVLSRVDLRRADLDVDRARRRRAQPRARVCCSAGSRATTAAPLDTLIQRLIEFLLSIPTIPLWMGLAAAVPPTWSPIRSTSRSP